jgi:PKD repeat protein
MPLCNPPSRVDNLSAFFIYLRSLSWCSNLLTCIYTRAGVYTVTLSVSDGVVTDTLTRTNYITATGGTVYTTTTRVITYTYECAASLKRSERDKLYRLTDADYSSGESFAYGYDPVGNPVFATLRGTNPTSTALRGAGCRTVQTRTLTSTTVITYAYDAANRLNYFYEDGVLTDLDWDFVATCSPKAPTCILGTPPTAW